MLSLSRYLRIVKQFTVLLFLFKNTLLSQNLIRNGSFGNYNTPINWNFWSGDFIGYYVNPADTIMIDWKQYNSPDFFTSACTHTFSGVPVNIFGSSYAKANNEYVGISVFQANNLEYKEYIYQQLSLPLQMGKIYCLNFYVSKADRKEYAVKNIGAYFCPTLPSIVSNMYINAIPQVVNTNGFISDTTQWTEIQGCFTANGGEQYIIIGNFNSNVNTDTLYTGTNNPIPSDPQYAYYYIDDITLIDQTTVGVNELNNGSGFEVYPNPARDEINFKFANSTEKRKVELYDAIGELVLTSDILTQNTSFKTHHLQSGVYFYRILVKDKVIKTDKIVIIK
ncbi:MAG: T9SS type A sorting domain-containing protein [Bacteroidetes bacterium]|nr:T9SS type A sorting domain-containing protein [Bacteroidota bacterium]